MKTAIISGASRGIGKTTAISLAKEGYRVIVNYLNSQESADKVCEDINSAGGSAIAYKADMSDPSQIVAMTQYVKNNFGSIDLVVANAGIGLNSLLIDCSDEEIRKVIDVNLIGVITLCREVGKIMLSQKSGNIVTLSSMWGQVGGSCESVYSAAKGGIIAFTKAIAKEFSLSGVRANCVAPGFIDTSMNSNLSQSDKLTVIDEIPLFRAGSPQDVADAILWLASEKASYVTGQVISVNGGLII
ncbi:MAG: SDR family oxidoreductase [Clostridia bacterium]|nr:SDR family oxidoreductase [Clostridia bacterium]MDE6758977.1 SDR family oxidoreductase [Clostridia bacterium]MDE7078897.1 SDR family oxidoreductase [Clostridia bacterium]